MLLRYANTHLMLFHSDWLSASDCTDSVSTLSLCEHRVARIPPPPFTLSHTVSLMALLLLPHPLSLLCSPPHQHTIAVIQGPYLYHGSPCCGTFFAAQRVTFPLKARMNFTELTAFVSLDVAARIPLWSTRTVSFADLPPVVVSTPPSAVADGAKCIVCVEVSERITVDAQFASVVSKVAEQCCQQLQCSQSDLRTYIAFVDNGGSVSYYECQLVHPSH